ncbi:60S ribosomal protein L9 [Diplonema papillatum]|nr:60S ribosomal protein L9 [Diplonema papillatum]
MVGVIVADLWFGRQIQIATIKTVLSHIRNMFIGVRVGFRYRMRFAYAHFPVSVTVEDREVAIRNFLGEKYVRRVNVLGDTIAKRTENNVTKDELTLEGNDINDVSQTAAAIHGACLVKRKDIRKFLDGIYVSAKENIVEE